MPAAGRPCASRFVLLAGSARSGTTWLGKLFDSHPDVVYRHEPDAVRALDIEPRDPSELDPDYRRSLFDEVDRMLETRATRSTARAPFFHKNYYSPQHATVRVPMLHACRIAACLLGDFDVPEPRLPDRSVRHVWKSVGRGAMLLGVVGRVLPRSRGILIVRHPCGFVASQLRGRQRRAFSRDGVEGARWAHERIAATDEARARGLTADDIAGAGVVERLAWVWVWQNAEMLRNVVGLPNVRVLRYEDLCTDAERIGAALFDFVGLDWHGQSAAFLEQSTRVDRDAFYSLRKDPERSMNKWRSELSYLDGTAVLDVVRGSRPGALYDL